RGRGSRRRPRRRSAPLKARSRRLRQGPQLVARDLAVVEWDLAPVLELLALLVPLPGDQHRVASGGLAQRQPDRGPTVGFDTHVLGVAIEPGENLLDD